MTRTGGQERRRQLIAEAIRSFGSRGYDGTTLDAVAEAAGVRKQSLLYYFPAKEDLFQACLDELGERLSATLWEALENVPDDDWTQWERVIRSIFALADEWPEFPPFVREASWRGFEVVTRVASQLDPLRKRAIEFLERGMTAGRFRRQDPTLLLFMIYTAVVGSLTEAGVLRAVAGRTGGRTALRRREAELIEFVRAALEP